MNAKTPELLAPAGTPEAAWAALSYGAGAVYAGLPNFSARAGAGNFTGEALDELIGYAHSLNRRVYITFNTLVQQRELGTALEALALIRDLNADAIIVQDAGIARLVRKNFPGLRLHASTQLAVHNLAGALQLAESGFSRVVLARELGVSEIGKISRNCGIETEVFIHGALCFSYSGLCLFSSHLLGRSGNRGRCAYCCRQPFKVADKESLPFSMKDFCAAEHLPKLLEAGVSSLKIEGRMKSPLYVAAVTDFYQRLLTEKMDDAEHRQLLSDIQTVFGRPSTDLYLENQAAEPVDPVNDGHRGAFIGTVKSVSGRWLILHSNRALQKHDGLKIETAGNHPFGFAADEMRLATDPEKKRRFELPAHTEIALKLPDNAPFVEIGIPVYCSFSQAVRQRYEFTVPRPARFRQPRPVNIHVFQSPEKTVLTASGDCDGTAVEWSITINGPFEAARQPEKSAEAVQRSFEKLGETDWQLGNLTFDELSAAVFVPASVLNEARRRLIEEFSNHWKQSRKDFQCLEVFPALGDSPPVCWSVKTRFFQGLENMDEVEEFILELDLTKPEELQSAIAALPAGKLRIALPAIIREDEVTAFRTWIDALPDQKKWEAANIGGLQLLKGKTDITADWPLYTLNTQAALEWKDQGIRQFVLSPEDDALNLSLLLPQLGNAAIVPVYQHTPLMISATRPAVHRDGFTDRSLRSFRVEKNGQQYVLVSETPYSLVHNLEQLQELGARNLRIDLSYGVDSSEQASSLIRNLIARHPVSGHTGNFGRELQ